MSYHSYPSCDCSQCEAEKERDRVRAESNEDELAADNERLRKVGQRFFDLVNHLDKMRLEEAPFEDIFTVLQEDWLEAHEEFEQALSTTTSPIEPVLAEPKDKEE